MSALKIIFNFMIMMPIIVKANGIVITEENMKSSKNAIENLVSILEEDEKRLKSIQAILTSGKWIDNQNTYSKQIMNQINSTNQVANESNLPLRVLPKIRPILFISSSIPIQTLRNYAADLSRVNGIMVLRGGIGGLTKIGPTMSFIAQILKIDIGCEADCRMQNTEILIDPILFRRNKVYIVPALTFQDDISLENQCKNESNDFKINSVIFGDSSIKALLEELSNQTNNLEIKALLEKLI